MKAELKTLIGSGFDERVYCPDDEEQFCFGVEATIGPFGEDCSEIFEFLVCTPKWISTQMIKRDFGDYGVFGRHMIIVKDYDFEEIKAMLVKLCKETSGADWAEIAGKLSKYGAWEYADYQS